MSDIPTLAIKNTQIDMQGRNRHLAGRSNQEGGAVLQGKTTFVRENQNEDVSNSLVRRSVSSFPELPIFFGAAMAGCKGRMQ